MPKDMIIDAQINVVAGKPVELPNGNFVANAEMARDGADLHLTSPDGHTIVVKGYFTADPVPDLVTHDGARMTPHLVSAFLPPEHAGQYAASGQMANDASPSGKITEVVGDAHIVHADGTKSPATVGASVYQGDIVETSKTGAVNIQFADNTAFAVSDNARLSVDQFVYDSAHHTGSSFFSMLQGVFVYTSGLIGKSDPGSVNIETPVGSIGIRGTVVAGTIAPAGQESKITILDGAISLTNGSGTSEMNNSFSTVSLNGYNNHPVDLGRMDAHTFNAAYHSVAGVAPETMTHFSSTAPHEGSAPTPPAGAAPNDHGTAPPAPPAGASPPAGATPPAGAAPPHAGDATPNGTAPSGSLIPPSGTIPADAAHLAGTVPAPGMMPADAMGMMTGMNTMMPGTMTGMNTMMPGTMTGSTFAIAAGTVTFGALPGTTAATGTTTFATTAATGTTTFATTAATETTTFTTTAGATNTTTTTAGTTTHIGFAFAPDYFSMNDGTAGTPTATTGGLQEFADVGMRVGQIMINGFPPANALSCMVAVNGANLPLQIVPNGTTGGYTLTTNVPYATAFSMDSLGNLYVNDPLLLSHFVNPNGLDLTITVTDAGTGMTSVLNQHIDIQDSHPGVQPQIFVGTGNDTITLSNLSFGYIDGGTGNNTLVMPGTAGAGTLDLANLNLGPVRNIENINLGTSGLGFHIGIMDVYAMAGANHYLRITDTSSATPSAVSVITGGLNDLTLTYGIIGSSSTLMYTGILNSSNVTLEIDNAMTSSNMYGISVTDVTHSLAPPVFNFNPTNYNVATFPGSFPGGQPVPGIAEFTGAGAVVGYAYMPSAPAGDNITYSISSVMNGVNSVHDVTLTPGTFNNAAGFPFFINATTGMLTVIDPLAMSYAANPGGFNVAIQATDNTLGQTTFANMHFYLQDYLPGVNPTLGTGLLYGTLGPDFLVTTYAGGATITGGGGADVILGGGGNDSINIANNAFRYIDGEMGANTLILGTSTTPLFGSIGSVGLDFTMGGTGQVRNIETINLGTSNNTAAFGSNPGGGINANGNYIKLDVSDVFQMAGPTHQLTVMEGSGTTWNSAVAVVTSGMGPNSYVGDIAFTGATATTTPTTITYTGIYHGVTVTLVIDAAVNTVSAAGQVHVALA